MGRSGGRAEKRHANGEGGERSGDGALEGCAHCLFSSSRRFAGLAPRSVDVDDLRDGSGMAWSASAPGRDHLRVRPGLAGRQNRSVAPPLIRRFAPPSPRKAGRRGARSILYFARFTVKTRSLSPNRIVSGSRRTNSTSEQEADEHSEMTDAQSWICLAAGKPTMVEWKELAGIAALRFAFPGRRQAPRARRSRPSAAQA